MAAVQRDGFVSTISSTTSLPRTKCMDGVDFKGFDVWARDLDQRLNVPSRIEMGTDCGGNWVFLHHDGMETKKNLHSALGWTGDM